MADSRNLPDENLLAVSSGNTIGAEITHFSVENRVRWSETEILSLLSLRGVPVAPTPYAWSLETPHHSCQQASWVSSDTTASLLLKDLMNNSRSERPLKRVVHGRKHLTASRHENFRPVLCLEQPQGSDERDGPRCPRLQRAFNPIMLFA